MITVMDPDAARTALTAGRLSCPQPGCGGILRVWSRARLRQVRGPGGVVEQVRPDRARCRTCQVTQVLLPAGCLPRRAYTVEVVGAALQAAAEGAGCARAAAAAGAPAATVRGWLRAVSRSVPTLTAQAIVVAEAAGHASACWLRPRRTGTALAEAVNALGAAARAFHLVLATSRPSGSGGTLTGIDYLALVAERHRGSLLHRLRLVDPTGLAAHAPPWQLINVITAGRLLAPSG